MTASALAWASPFFILAGIAAIAWSILGGHRIRCLPRVIAYRACKAVLRARWAWRCRGHPAVTSERDPLGRDDMRAFLGLVRCWRHGAAAERSRT